MRDQVAAEGVSNGAELGDVLEYRIYLNNPSDLPATGIVIHDRTPPYTELASAIPSPVNLGGGLVCRIVTPSSNVAGYSGSLRWGGTGNLLSGGAGAVTFKVLIAP
ncbi:hypothetical protein [Pacificibacter marinus]|uniref:hypothetical protein n=1 Tax=Pacificibacter marinus TaxID=658057 RepID=UPI000A26D1E8|nr:hypothetical protein [Pacificibacter marinus]